MWAVAGSMNGLLSYGILKNLNHKNGWLAWRYIFLIEGSDISKAIIWHNFLLTLKLGLMSITFGFVILLALPSSPEKLGRLFTEEEKQLALRRYREAFNVEGDTKVRWKSVLAVFKDIKAWFYGPFLTRFTSYSY